MPKNSDHDNTRNSTGPDVQLRSLDDGQHAWLTTAPPKRRWLLRQTANRGAGWLPLGDVGVLAAESGTGKTTLLCQLALAVASQTEWLTSFKVPEEGCGKVLLALGEESEDEIHRRLFRAQEEVELTDEELARARRNLVPWSLRGRDTALLERNAQGHYDVSAFFDALVRQLNASEEEWRLIILDPLIRFVGTQIEADHAAATRLLEAAEALTQVKGHPTVLLSQRVDSTPTAHPASVTRTGARWVATLTPQSSEGERLILQIVKANTANPGVPVWLVRNDTALLIKDVLQFDGMVGEGMRV